MQLEHHVKSTVNYFKSGWNILDLISIITSLVATILALVLNSWTVSVILM